MARVFTEDDFAPDEPAKPVARVFTEDDFNDAPSAPGTGDVNPKAPVATPAADDYAKPNALASTIRGIGEGIGVAPLGRKITAAGQAAYDKLTGGEFDYDERLKAEEARARGAATEHPAAYATGRVGGGVVGALRLSPTVLAGMAGANTLMEGGDLGDAANNALMTAGLMKLPGRIGGVVGAGMSAASAANAPTKGDQYADAADALMGLGGAVVPHRLSRLDRMADEVKPPRARAEGDVRAQTADEVQRLGQEGVGEREAFQQDYDKRYAEGRQGAEALNREVKAAVKSQTDAAREAFNEQRDADRLAMQNRADARATADDLQQRARTQAEEAMRAQRQEEDRQHRLSKLDFEDRFAKDMAAYEQRVAAHEQAVASAKDAASRIRAETEGLTKLRAEQQRLEAAYEKQQAAVADEIAALERLATDPEASATGEMMQAFREAQTRITNAYRANEILNQTREKPVEFPKEWLGLLEFSTDSLFRNMPEAVARLKQIREAGGGQAWAKIRAAELAGEAKKSAGLSKEAVESEAAPDFREEARKSLAEKERLKAELHPEDRAVIEKRWKDAGYDPTGKTDAELRAGPDAALPPKPAKPGRDAHEKGVRDWLRQRLLAEPPSLPPKPDRVASRIAGREERVALRNAPGFEEPTVSRDALAADRISGYPDMPNPANAPNPADLPKGSSVLNRMIEERIAQGRQNVTDALSSPNGPKRDLISQYIRELPESTSTQALRAALLTLVGGGAGVGVGGPAGGVAGAALGAAASKYLSRPKERFLHSKFLGDSESMAGVKPGDAAKLRFSNPNEAAAILRDVEQGLRKRSTLSQGTAGRIEDATSRAALQAALQNPAFIEWLKKKMQEREATP